uniref:Uncharacterized protein n=1 Tax=Desulfobacca acetoxidans TaxID=60893 RepID=A0A7C3V2M4_9BACT
MNKQINKKMTEKLQSGEEVRMKQIHFCIEWELFRRFRALFPDKGDMQRMFRQMLIEFLEKYEDRTP